MLNLATRFINYCNKVYALDQRLSQVKDGRKTAQYSLPSLLMKMISGIVTGIRSFNQLEETVNHGIFDGIGDPDRPTADTFNYALTRLDLDSLTRVLDKIITDARRNKALDETDVEGWRVVAIDGTGVFSTHSERLGRQAHHRKGVHGENVEGDLYCEYALAVSYVSASGVNVLLELVRVPSGQGETTTAVTVMKSLYQRHCRFCDVVTLDAGFARAPILNTLIEQNKHFVLRVKQDNYNIIKDADGLFAGQAPHEIHRDIQLKDANVVYDVEIWEDEGFTSWETVSVPLRCLKIREVRKAINAKGEVVKSQEVVTHLVTTANRMTMKALTVWKIAHQRWDIENTGFHFLKHHFQLEHAYGYDPALIETMYKLFAITYNLFQLFVRRNLRSFRPGKDTLLGVMRRIYEGFVVLAYMMNKRWSVGDPELDVLN
jgi:hypothetical protein